MTNNSLFHFTWFWLYKTKLWAYPYSKVTSTMNQSAPFTIYLGCDSKVLKRITQFRVDRQGEKNGQFDFEVRTELNGGKREKWSQKKACECGSQCNPFSRPMSAGHTHGMWDSEGWAKSLPTGCFEKIATYFQLLFCCVCSLSKQESADFILLWFCSTGLG